MWRKINNYLKTYFKNIALNSLKLREVGNKKAEFLSRLLTATVVLEEVRSPINGEIKVIKSLAFGTYIQAGNLTQSGGILYDVWKKPLKKISNLQFPISNILILGLGGGTLVKLIKKFWPNSKVTAVDIDPVMIELGKKYLGLKEKDVKMKIGDAYKYLVNNNKSAVQRYDLIMVDLYIGDEYPQKFEGDDFISLAKSYLKKEGIIIFNRLYYAEKRKFAVKFLARLEKHFKKVDVVYPQANVMFICYP